MTSFLKTTIIAATAAFAIGSPAFAETFLNEMGTGDVHPIIHQAGANIVFDRAAGLRAYASVRGRTHVDPNSPTLTGGGSTGYNQMNNAY
jgi:hypothetical protein